MALRFVDLEDAKRAEGLRLVLLRDVPSPWSQAAKAIVELDQVDALGVWMRAADAEVTAWTGMPNAPVALYPGEPPRSGWAEILALAERLSPAPRLVPGDAAARVRMFGLSHELMGEGGLLWNARRMTVDASLRTDGELGFAVPVARYLGQRYGHAPGCEAAARDAAREQLTLLEAELGAGPYYFGEVVSALDVYSAAAFDALVPLLEAQCATHPRLRKAFVDQLELLGPLPASLLAHRDRMHERHMPLPMVTGPAS